MKRAMFHSLIVVFIFWGNLPVYCQQKNFRIITWNVYEGMKLDTTQHKTAFAKWITGKDPDVMAFQEMNRFTPASLDKFARSYGHTYSVLLKENGFPVAITSKYPI